MNHNKKFQVFFSVLLILALAVGMSPAGSAKAYGTHTIYVRQLGSDTCTGLSNVNYSSGTDCAKASIAGALLVAVAGDKIYVDNGGDQWNMAISDPITISTGVEIVLTDKTFIVPDAGKGCFVIAGNGVRISAEHSTYAGCFGKAGTHYITVNDGVTDVIIDGMMLVGPGAGTSNDIGIYFAGAVTNVQVVNNYFENIANGIDLKFTAMPGTGVADIKGNYFEHTTRGAVSFPITNTFDMKYNSWGYFDGPVVGDADIPALNGATYSPVTYAKVLFAFDSGHSSGTAIVGDTVTVSVQISAKNLTGADFVVNFPNGALRFDSASMDNSLLPNSVGPTSLSGLTSSDGGYATAINSDGKIKFHGLTALAEGGQSYTVLDNSTALVYTLHFTAISSGGSPFGVSFYSKAFTMNPGYGPTNMISARGSETSFTVLNTGTVNATVSMQGRIARDNAVMKFWQSSAEKFSATSLDQMVNNLSFLTVPDGTYTVTITKPGYLSLLDTLSKTATFSSGHRTLNSLELKGGDADGNNVITVLDAEAIGSDYGYTGGANTSGKFTDINSSGLVDIYDLALMGGNYELSSVVTTSANPYYNWSPLAQ